MSSKDSIDSFGARDTLKVGDNSYEIFRLDAVPGTEKLPSASRCWLENLLRTEDGANVTKEHIQALASWDADGRTRHRDPVHARPRDHAGLHRSALHRRPGHHARGDGRPRRRPEEDQPARARRAGHRPLGDRRPVRHARTPSSATSRSSTSATASATSSCAGARRAFDDFKVVPPGTGIVHQVNIEYLARVVYDRRGRRRPRAYPDTCVGTDSHTTMVNGLGVLGWGVGGIEAEAAMLGQPVSMLIPRVVGFKLTGEDADRRHRHRRSAHRSPRCCASTAWSASSSSSTARASPRCRWPTAPPSAT